MPFSCDLALSEEIRPKTLLLIWCLPQSLAPALQSTNQRSAAMKAARLHEPHGFVRELPILFRSDAGERTKIDLVQASRHDDVSRPHEEMRFTCRLECL